jgi:tellurite resistance protein
MSELQVTSKAVERKYAATQAVAGADEGGPYLEIDGVKVRAYQAGGVVNIAVDLSEAEGEIAHAFHVQGTMMQAANRRAGVPRNLTYRP